ncbi:phosphotransferase enzyme family protein [Fictibacillus barbaricus]|uniref:Ser/Thr protein kinase RdoA (MazF antagonist) n=1 Tax=Fictibacillus barbaricus TaxID=182136 RepID=A0ABU1TX48_9BACL|nr:phosphotransferase [Fictibacillus barbaricus]MDR7071778.1 Ser/Thr protein kinase RdoA (MazF antagonist) [Fictibacillus barbaricus]
MIKDIYFLTQAAALYGTIPEKLQPINEGFQNKIYQFSKNNTKWILRITTGKHKSHNLIQGELDYILFLKRCGLSVSEPVLSIKGNLIEKIQCNGESYYCSAFVKAEGGHIRVQDPAQWNASLFKSWGELLGRIHKAGKQYEIELKDSQVKRPRWSEEHPYNHELFLKVKPGAVKDKYESVVSALRTFTMDANHFGLIHNDYHQGNIFVKDGTITVFDFDDCCYFWFAYDIAAAFYHAYWQHTSYNEADLTFDQTFLVPFMKGYAEGNTLTEEIIDQVPLFLKLRELFLYQLFHKVWDINQLEDWQAYTINNLEKNIETNTVYAGLDENRILQIKKALNVFDK